MDPRTPALALQALLEIERVLSLAADPTKGFNSVLQVLSSHLGLENGTISLFDPVTGEVFIEAAPEMLDAERILGRLRPGEGIVGRVFRDGCPMVIPDLFEEPRFLNRTGSREHLDTDRRAFYALPLREGRTTVGVLTADRRWAAGPFSFTLDQQVLAIVAGLVAVRIRLDQLGGPRLREGDDGAPARGLGADPERFRAAVGRSPAWRAVLEVIAQVAPSRATVLLRGESGTGKEVVARELHEASQRAGRPFVAVNCAALPEALLESALFGHEKGAFTGAHERRVGCFEAADGGTLFLDEIGELPLPSQVKLLRAIQERQFERLGGRRTVTVDVRLVAATNRDLESAVRAGQFRLDLYHRLQVVEVVLPPLRSRPEDVPLLVGHFLAQLAQEHGRSVSLSADAMEALARAPWPGNVRQLRNVLERVVVSHPAAHLTAADLLPLLPPEPEPPFDSADPLRGSATLRVNGLAQPRTTGDPPRAPDERTRVLEALHRAGHVQARAARLLGMTVRQLRYRIAKHGIVIERF